MTVDVERKFHNKITKTLIYFLLLLIESFLENELKTFSLKFWLWHQQNYFSKIKHFFLAHVQINYGHFFCLVFLQAPLALNFALFFMISLYIMRLYSRDWIIPFLRLVFYLFDAIQSLGFIALLGKSLTFALWV